MPLLDGDGALVTFISGSVGGRIATGKLCQSFLKNKARPIVKLDVGSFRSKDYGTISSPEFSIVGFEGVEAEDTPEHRPAKNGNDATEFSDAIPF